ncbi:hypothetical protein [Jeongeupia chitinilytica]|uniref:Uncharacterized protein n=1 Tax=Jeongeupia chitinilytica TaxID=1041641 RepID=A0ABQ3H0W3_9NEIS|nr:hypothetical protein [Jeongeupia chitinilytica]GHD61908.1 hypothetical protein GCM10007350_16990 [Jeongeupia chitinilytica]
MKSLPQWLRASFRQSLMTVGVLALVLQLFALPGSPSQMNYLLFFAIYFPVGALAACFRARSFRSPITHS